MGHREPRLFPQYSLSRRPASTISCRSPRRSRTAGSSAPSTAGACHHSTATESASRSTRARHAHRRRAGSRWGSSGRTRYPCWRRRGPFFAEAQHGVPFSPGGQKAHFVTELPVLGEAPHLRVVFFDDVYVAAAGGSLVFRALARLWSTDVADARKNRPRPHPPLPRAAWRHPHGRCPRRPRAASPPHPAPARAARASSSWRHSPSASTGSLSTQLRALAPTTRQLQAVHRVGNVELTLHPYFATERLRERFQQHGFHSSGRWRQGHVSRKDPPLIVKLRARTSPTRRCSALHGACG